MRNVISLLLINVISNYSTGGEIVDCIVNENNKQECVNRLIKNYSSTKPKYIRIISEEYNNINLSKVLKKEVRKVDKVDNPQKRRELGVY